MPRKPRPWFRFYVEACADRKLRRLKPEYRWLFVACLAAARTSPEPGVLLVAPDDPMGVDDLADWAGMDLKAVAAGTAALVTAGALDIEYERYPREAWFVPAWGARQFESDDVTVRTAKHRSKERSNDVGRNTPEQSRAEQSRPPSSPPTDGTLVDFTHHDSPKIDPAQLERLRALKAERQQPREAS